MKGTLAVFALLLPATVAAQPKHVKKDQIPADAAADVQAAIKELFSSKPLTRAEAVGRLKSKGAGALAALPFLVDLLDDGGQLKIVRYSKTTGNQMGEGTPTTVGKEVADALPALGNDALIPLAAALKTSSPTARSAAFDALVHKTERSASKDPRVLDLVLLGLKEPDVGVRDTLAYWLSDLRKLDDPRVPQALRLVLSDADPKVREHALVLLNYREPHAIDVLIQMLKDPATPAERREEAHGWLVKLVTKDLGPEAAVWEAWWAENRTKWLNWDPTKPHPKP